MMRNRARRAPALRALLVACAAAAAAHGAPAGEAFPRAVPGGFVTRGSAAPYRVVCMGARIAPRIVLTAAHCVPPAVDPLSRLAFVAEDAPEGATPAGVAAVHRHPAFRSFAHPRGAANDLAVVELVGGDAPDTPSSTALPAPQRLRRGDLVEWAPRERGTWNPARRRLPGVVLSVSRSELVIATRDGRQPCVGDSGAPVYRLTGNRAELVALVSGSVVGDDACQRGAVCTRVDRLSGWLRRATSARR